MSTSAAHAITVMTAEGGRYELIGASQPLKKLFAYTSDGKLHVLTGSAEHPQVLSFIAKVERKNDVVASINPVSAEQLDALYREFESRAGMAEQDVRKLMSDMQRQATQILQQAMKADASDVHIVVNKATNSTHVSFRIQGDLELRSTLTYEVGDLLTRTFYQVLTDVSDSTFKPNRPQDARIGDPRWLPPGLDGVRLATAPLGNEGIYMVLRLLRDYQATDHRIEPLGYAPDHARLIEFMKSHPAGINYIVGPTGSGKSTTLQRVIAGIISESQGRTNVLTVEDPPEYPIPGAKQIPVANAETDEERTREFQTAIRASMRLDPDVIMIGETRDRSSADLAFRAAMTGHQVYSTLHGNSALATFDRLLDIGVHPNILFDHHILTGIIFQRLIKVLCQSCRVPWAQAIQDGARFGLTEQSMSRYRMVFGEEVGRVYFAHPEGCEYCGRRGTRGRTVLAEVLVPDDTLMTLMRQGDKHGAKAHWVENGGRTIRHHAADKVLLGEIDPVHTEEQIGLLTLSLIKQDRTISTHEAITTLPEVEPSDA